MKPLLTYLSFGFLFFALAFHTPSSSIPGSGGEKIKGINFTAPVSKPSANPFGPVIEVHADWISVIPYAYSKPGHPEVSRNLKWQWWGERTQGTRETIAMAKEKGLKVMLKPHIWVRGQGWAGDFECKSEDDWKKWEEEYEAYIMELVELAVELDVEMFCVGTEYRKAAQRRSAFWRDMIRRIRRTYKGGLTYAANWDSYKKISFWDELDYIGVDVYFPLSDAKTPTPEELTSAWKPYVKDLKNLCEKEGKPLLLTEYGYCSTDYPAKRPWEETNAPPNMQAQMQAYEGLYKSLWQQDWVVGGFIWKWFSYHNQAGGLNHKGFTPQNKPVIEVIKEWYRK